MQKQGKVCVLDIEMEGAKQIRKTNLNPLFVFIQPPSIEELERRLRERQTETEESLQKRLNTAKLELEYGKAEGNFDFIVQNTSLKEAYSHLRDFLVNEIEEQRKEGINVSLSRAAIGDF